MSIWKKFRQFTLYCFSERSILQEKEREHKIACLMNQIKLTEPSAL